MESKGGLFRGSVDDIAFPFVSTLNGATGFNGGCLFFLLQARESREIRQSVRWRDTQNCEYVWLYASTFKGVSNVS